jgi:hypothetical protein
MIQLVDLFVEGMARRKPHLTSGVSGQSTIITTTLETDAFSL